MAEAVRAAGAHYALKLKGNNGPLHACAVKTFGTSDGNGKGASCETSETGHDRFERRRVTTVAVPKDAPRLPGLVLFARIKSERQKTGGKSEAAIHYLALSKRMPPRRVLEIVRQHWGGK